MEPKYPNVRVSLSEEDGNAFAVLGRVVSALRSAGVPPEEVEEFRREAMSGDYAHLLRTCGEWVEVE